MRNQKQTTVEKLCQFAGIEYEVLGGNPRVVNFVQHGGHRKVRVPERQIGSLYVDMTKVPEMGDKKQRAVELLTILAVELDCYEAGESLAANGLVETQSNGKFMRRELVLSR